MRVSFGNKRLYRWTSISFTLLAVLWYYNMTFHENRSTNENISDYSIMDLKSKNRDWSLNSSEPPRYRFEKNLLQRNLGGDKMWDIMITEAKAILQSDPDRTLTVIEVGAQSLVQSITAAKAGLVTLTFEPSPLSFREMQRRRSVLPKDVKERIRLFHRAVGARGGETVRFRGTGGTGDHVLTEKAGVARAEGDVTVATVSLDEVIANEVRDDRNETTNVDEVFLLKVDTQGYEPAVFSGLKRGIEGEKIKYILFEYWPRGMDRLFRQEEPCAEPVKILRGLVDAGYTLYALGAMSHPHANPLAQTFIKRVNRFYNIFKSPDKEDFEGNRPLDDLESNCKWYLELEKTLPDKTSMGYWTDIFAVAPHARLNNPVTPVARLLDRR